VGTGRARSFQDLIAATFRALGREPNIETVPLPADLRGKYQFFTQATVAKLKRTGFTHEPLSVEDGARDYVVNHLQKEPAR
jgi:ADP-L-glycero-D-manno-heptose 6-epimerase